MTEIETLKSLVNRLDEISLEVGSLIYPRTDVATKEMIREVYCSICDAVIALNRYRRQIPSKPICYDSVPHARCPACKCAVKVYFDEPQPSVCPWCGQKFDWEEENE